MPPSPPPPFPEPCADPSIDDYAAIGDCRTIALVSRFGSIDWWCVPHFSAPALFAGLLDRRRGGRFALMPRDIVRAEQAYEADSNVLRTRFVCRGGELELFDFMPLPDTHGAELGADASAPACLVRVARCVRGRVTLQLALAPRPDFARRPASWQPQAPGHWALAVPGLPPGHCTTSLPVAIVDGGATLAGHADLEAGACRHAVLTIGGTAVPASQADALAQLDITLACWRRWCSRCHYDGPHRGAVMRSCLALKLLTYRPSGAVVAAGTTSLPEGADGARNWDYRYCWLRDTSLVLHAFADMGFRAESEAFLHWLLRATRRSRPRLQVVYDVHGKTELAEHALPGLSGYHGIGPVRIGNAASGQLQHDVYGEVILTACDFVDAGGRLGNDERRLIGGFAGVVCDLWREPDHGIWEIRLPPRHNTHSKLMCWVALDRALTLHRRAGVPLDAARVARERDALRADIEAHAFSRALNSYVGFYGAEAADASLLLMPRMGYIAADDPRMRGTVAQIEAQLAVDGLLRRYPGGRAYDGVAGSENLFAICSFWHVDCLARQGRIDEAQALYERLLSLRSPAGLYAEQFDLNDGRPVGNFPQAFSHVGSITAAVTLARAQRLPR